MVSHQIFTADRDSLSHRAGKRPYTTFGTLIGATLVVVGTYLPWFQWNPNYDGTWGGRLIPHALTEAGIGLPHVLFLLPLGVAVAVFSIRGATRGWAVASVIAGLWTALLPGIAVYGEYIENWMYIPTIGLGMAVLGGSLLIITGGYALFGTK